MPVAIQHGHEEFDEWYRISSERLRLARIKSMVSVEQQLLSLMLMKRKAKLCMKTRRVLKS